MKKYITDETLNYKSVLVYILLIILLSINQFCIVSVKFPGQSLIQNNQTHLYKAMECSKVMLCLEFEFFRASLEFKIGI